MSARIGDSFIRGVTLSYDVSRTLVAERTAHQELLLIDNERFGRVLMLDGTTQVTTADEFIYHEMLAHVPILAHGDVQDVLIIGGGDCGLAEEVLKHRGLSRVVQVEIDACVVEASRRYLSEINARAFDDERFHLHIGDGATFIDHVEERFDVVLIDSTDPVGAASKLFTAEFYRSVRRALRSRGIVVAQAGVPFVQPSEFSSTIHNLAQAFQIVSCYVLASPSYFGGHLALAWASDSRRPITLHSTNSLEQRLAADLHLRYYTPDVHRAAFALPAYIKEMMDSAVQR